ncbi:MAG: 30S ribosomal protein S20 [Candidatus Anammoxibacter sp.]
MPSRPSAKKSLKQNEVRRLRNKARVSALKTQNKKLLSAIAGKDIESIDKHLPLTVKLLDKTVAKGIIKKKTVSRKKSKLMKQINKVKAAKSKK